jgi:hypothetical protein
MTAHIKTEAKSPVYKISELQTIMSHAYNKDWDLINAFTVLFLGKGVEQTTEVKGVKQTTEVKGDKKTGSGDKLSNITKFNEAIASSIISLDTPQFNSQNIESFMGGRWYINNGRDEVYRFSMTFRDFNNLSLYRIFTKMYFRQRYEYFDSVAFSVIIGKSQALNAFGGTKDTVIDSDIFKFEETIIDSISQVQFSNNTEAQIAEFTVQFKSGRPFFSSNIDLGSLKI